MNRVHFDVDFLMQPSRFAGATVFFNTIGQTAGKASIKILGAPHSRRCFLKNVCFSVQNPVEMGLIVSKSMLKSARLIFCIVIRRKLTGYFYADSSSKLARIQPKIAKFFRRFRCRKQCRAQENLRDRRSMHSMIVRACCRRSACPCGCDRADFSKLQRKNRAVFDCKTA